VVVGAGAGAAAWLDLVSLSLVDQVVLAGVAVVLPLALGGQSWWWTVATATTAASFLVPAGHAVILIAPPMTVVLVVLGGRLQAVGPLLFWRLRDVAEVLASGYAVVAVASLSRSRQGGEVFGTGEPIVELTAVHFIYAGSAALVLAAATVDSAAGTWRRIARPAVVLTAAAPPLVALGFVTGAAVPQVGGAVLMSLGVFSTATLHLRAATTGNGSSPARVLLGISGLAVWVPMVLAVAWAAGQHVGGPALSIPDMARTHGLMMAFGFVVCGLLGRRLSPDSIEASPPAEATGPTGGLQVVS
jgi:hypothetical protein